MEHMIRITVERGRILPRHRLEAVLDCFNTPSRSDEDAFERLRALRIEGAWSGPNDTLWHGFDALHRVHLTVECHRRDAVPAPTPSMAEPPGMDPETLSALQGSIRKWEGIVAGTERDLGWENCPLCAKFNKIYRGEPHKAFEECTGCPVARASGFPSCWGTPYQTFVHARDLCDGCSPEELHQLARDELDFLKSLLPSPAAA